MFAESSFWFLLYRALVSKVVSMKKYWDVVMWRFTAPGNLHPIYGVVTLSRIQINEGNLFQSTVKGFCIYKVIENITKLTIKEKG